MDTGKLVVIVAASEMTREYQITSTFKKMASVAMLIRGALANALAFTGSSYLFHRLSKDTIDKERKRHDLAIEKLQKAQIEWVHKRQQQIDFINKQFRLERKCENIIKYFVTSFHPCLENLYPVTTTPQAMNSITESWDSLH